MFGFGHGGGFGPLLGPLFWLLVVGVVIWAIARGRGIPPQTDSALEILKRRYARGEIDEAEYERRRRELED